MSSTESSSIKSLDRCLYTLFPFLLVVRPRTDLDCFNDVCDRDFFVSTLVLCKDDFDTPLDDSADDSDGNNFDFVDIDVGRSCPL